MKTLIIAVASLFSSYTIAAVPATLDGSLVMDYSHKHLSMCGTLGKASDGFVYLKISDRYINDLFPLLLCAIPPAEAAVVSKPPYMENGKIGAHVSVIYAGELPKPITSFPEKGRKECFTVSGLFSVDPESGPFQRVYYLRVQSGDLEKIRQNYRLSPLYQHRDFHITVGVINREES